MPVKMDSEQFVGDYRGTIIEYALVRKEDDGKFAGLRLNLKVAAEEVWQVPEGATDPQWLNCEPWDAIGEGAMFLISKETKYNDRAIKLLYKLGWDGDFESLGEAQTWSGGKVRFDIAKNSYKNRSGQDVVTYKINYVNDYDTIPGPSGSNVGSEEAKSLNAQFGSALRALRGNLDRAAKPAPAGKPAAPTSPPGARPKPQPRPRPAAPAAAAPVAAPQEPIAEAAAPQDDIPF